MNRLWTARIAISALIGLTGLVAGSVVNADTDRDGVDESVDLGRPTRDVPPPNTTATILIDRGHSGYFPTLGYLSFLVENGWQVQETEEPLTLDLLLTADILLVPPSASAFSGSEIQAVFDFVTSGRALWLFGEIYGPYSGSAALAAEFGVGYHWNSISDPVHNEGFSFWPTISNLAVHPVNAGVTEYGFYAGVCMDVGGPAIVIARASESATSTVCGAEPPVMAAYEDGGRALFCGDMTPFSWTYFPDELDDDEILLLNNMATWLAEASPVSAKSCSWSAVKALYR